MNNIQEEQGAGNTKGAAAGDRKQQPGGVSWEDCLSGVPPPDDIASRGTDDVLICFRSDSSRGESMQPADVKRVSCFSPAPPVWWGQLLEPVCLLTIWGESNIDRNVTL